MNPTQTAAIIRAVKALCPAQKFDEYTPDMWEAVLADTDFADAKVAIIALRRSSPWIGPSEIDTEVRRMRAERLERIVEPPPNDVEGVRYVDELRALRRAIADGTIADQAAAGRYKAWGGSLHRLALRGQVPALIAPEQPLRQRPVAQLLAGAFRTVPSPPPEDAE